MKDYEEMKNELKELVREIVREEIHRILRKEYKIEYPWVGGYVQEELPPWKRRRTECSTVSPCEQPAGREDARRILGYTTLGRVKIYLDGKSGQND